MSDIGNIEVSSTRTHDGLEFVSLRINDMIYRLSPDTAWEIIYALAEAANRLEGEDGDDEEEDSVQ